MKKAKIRMAVIGEKTDTMVFNAYLSESVLGAKSALLLPPEMERFADWQNTASVGAEVTYVPSETRYVWEWGGLTEYIPALEIAINGQMKVAYFLSEHWGWEVV